MVVWCFFFQAEDGIRDLVRSRGLGDVYKRQVAVLAVLESEDVVAVLDPAAGRLERLTGQQRGEAVSYTHLTLPTSDLV